MKQFLISTCIVLLSACQSIAVDSFTSTPNKINAATTPSSTYIFTPSPSKTSTATVTITSLPPQLFNPALIPTFTQSSPAQCPKENSNLKFSFEKAYAPAPPGKGNNEHFADYVLDFLNSGGTLQSILFAYEKDSNQNIPFFFIRDVTGDNIAELIFPYGLWLDIFTCKGGKFELIFIERSESDNAFIQIIDIDDINRDGLPEIVVSFNDCFGYRCSTTRIYRWNGEEFQKLIANPFNEESCSRLSITPYETKVEDIDNNGTKEIILTNNYPAHLDNDFPYRKETRICMWNGENFVVYKKEFDPPHYRFQAVQDGDRATLSGDYDKALMFYQQVINDENLEWFTLDRKWYEFWLYHSQIFPEPTPTASPSLQPDPNEYSTLATYAYFRTILLYVLQNDTVNAEMAFRKLQSDFPVEKSENYFTKVASIFWQDYQLSASIQSSCSKVVEYAQQHTLPTEYLGDWDHGAHSILYTPEEICPFR